MSSTQAVADEQNRGERQADEQESSEEELPVDEIFHILQNERRRMVLEYLQEADDSVRMRDVAEQVAAWENETTVEELNSDQRQRVYIPLYQSHLPKLDKAGIIDYQQNRGIVERRPLARQLDYYLNADSNRSSNGSTGVDRDGGWDDYYIGAAGIGAVLLLGAVFELPLFSLLTGVGLSALILLMFTALTIGQYVK
jgi:DNA-binding transcriptional ArsR family regulator